MMRPNRTKWLIFVFLFVVIIVAGLWVMLDQYSHAPAPIIPIAAVRENPTHTVIGKSVQGRDIDAYTYTSVQISTSSPARASATSVESSLSNINGDSGQNSDSPKHLLFVGGIHGGYEWNSVILAYTFMDYLKVNPDFVPTNFTITVIPSVNPDAVFMVVGKEGRFTSEDVSTSTKVLARARFNADSVDLNRNFDCKWQPKSTWQSKTVSAGTSTFSEPEAKALRDYVATFQPEAVVFWHSQSNAVYASQCKGGILPVTLDIMNAYAKASKYPAVKTFDAYVTTGAADDWLASIGIPAITVELSSHNTIEWARNLEGIRALLKYFGETTM